MPVNSRFKQDYTNVFLQATFGFLNNLHLKFGAILSKIYKDIYAHMYQNLRCNLLQKNFSTCIIR